MIAWLCMLCLSDKQNIQEAVRMDAIGILRDARSLIVEQGWTTGSYHDEAGFCLDGACLKASGVDVDAARCSDDEAPTEYWAARAALSRQLDAEGHDTHGPITFNDRQTDSGPVLALIDRTIARLEASAA